MKGQTWCSKCQEYKDDEKQIETSCRSVMATYGPIIVAKAWCKDCGKVLMKDRIIDDDGLRP